MSIKKKWNRFINNLSIKKKIVFYTYLVICPILLLITAVMFGHDYKATNDQQRQRGVNRVQSLENSLAKINESVSEMATYICINTNITQILTANNVEELNKNSKLWTDEAPMRFIRDTLAIQGYIKTLGIYPENGVQPYLPCMDSSAYLATMEQVRETEMYKEALEKRGKKCWTVVDKGSSQVYWANQSEKIILYREIYDLAKKRALGYLVIGADAGKYRELCESAMESDGEVVLIFNEESDILLSCGDNVEELKTLAREGLENGNTVESIGGYTAFYQTSEDSGQVICLLIPNKTVLSQILDIATTPILMLLGILAGLFPVMLFVSNIVTKPLNKVNEAMVQFRKGDFTQRVYVETHDEVGEVAYCFNQMVEDIKKLIDENYVMELREKESELTALQAQINPHFLYNTLDSLYWQAQEADNEEIAENILALSNLFRQVLGEGKSTTTVAQECNLLSAYLTVQKMRFTKRLNYEIAIEEAINEERISKLILQPFVENAVVHGFENMDKPCSIYVKGRAISEGIEFTIEDTGIGMDGDQVKAMLSTGDTEGYKGHRIGRYAVKNVKERLTLMYHDNFELLVTSALGKGTKITLRIYNHREEKENA